MSKRIILASAIIALMVSVAAMAVTFTVDFTAGDPDVTVICHKANDMSTDWAWQGTASFHLTGSSSAVGTIHAGTVGVFDMYTDVTGQPKVWGGYTASDGNFQSTFEANSYMTMEPCFGYGQWSTHSINATGVPSGSMTVSGDATAVWAGGASMGYLTEAGQTFSGEAEEVTVFGSKMHSGAGNVQPPDPAGWNPTLFEGAEFTATATGSSTVTFSGKTEGRTYPGIGDSVDDIWDRRVQHGLGFDIAITGSTLDGSLITTYSYTNALALEDPPATTTWIVGDTSTALNPPKWIGVPGYYTNP
jgi:hypothetical protein